MLTVTAGVFVQTVALAGETPTLLEATMK